MTKEPRTPPPPPAAPKEPANGPPDFPLLLWGLRLWILAALGIIAVAVANYLLNWIVR